MQIDEYEIKEQMYREQIHTLFDTISSEIGKERAMGLFAEINRNAHIVDDIDDVVCESFWNGYKNGFERRYSF